MDISIPAINNPLRNQEISTGSKDTMPNVQKGNENNPGQNLHDDRENVDSRELDTAVDKANKVLFKNNSHLQFRVHEKTKDIMVKIIDDNTGEVLKEIPPEKLLDMVAKIWEIAGIFVDERR